MPLHHASSELVIKAWLRRITDLPTNQIGATLPQDNTSWAASGFVQYIQTGNAGSSKYFHYRRPVFTLHFWAVNPDKQTPPWGKANDLAEIVWDELIKDDNGIEGLDLGLTGAPLVRVTQAWPVGEVRRIPWGFPSGQGSFVDPGNAAHFTLDMGIAWAELP